MTRKDATLFVLLSAIWGSSFMFIKLGLLGGFGPLTLVSLRLLFGAGVTWLLAMRQGQHLPRSLSLLIGIAFMGLINNALPFTLITWSEQYIDSSMAAILNSTVPLFAVVFSHFALKDESFTLRRAVGVVVGFLGVLVLFAPDLFLGVGGNHLIAQMAVICASAGYAVGSVFARKYLNGVAPAVLTATQLSFAFLWIVVPALWLERPWTLEPAAMAWFAALWLGILGSGLAYLIFFVLLRSIGATPTTMVTYVVPLFAVFFGIVFLQEQLRWEQLVALLLIIAGVWLANRGGAGGKNQKLEVSVVSD